MSEAQRQSRFESNDEVVVMKFGGTSVEDAAAIGRLVEIVRSRERALPVLVVSALAGVTDRLLEAGHAAAGGHLGAALATVRAIYVRHERLADELLEGAALVAVESELRGEYRGLEEALITLEAARVFDLQSQDLLLGFGECLSSRLVAAVLSSAGTGAAHVDARECIVTDAKFGQANPVWDATNERVQDRLIPLLDQGLIPVLGGFIAATSERVPTTLGRGGSDFTATIVGAALGAARVEIWTDVDGVMTADPKLCAEARVIRKLSFDEAAELAQFGAKVLHPATLAPAMRENIPVYVLNSREPEGEGTEIVARARSSNAVTAITAKRKVGAVEIDAAVRIDSELLRAVYQAFDDHACPIDVISSSLGRLSVLAASTARLPEIAGRLKGVAEVRWENHKALVCLVGQNLRRQPELASRAFAAVADMDVRMLCQDASDRTISFLVDEDRVEESVQRLHGLFFTRRDPSRDWGGISSAYCQAG